ncbi:hypothetical protein ACO0M4_10670 [Streptomyces sp. RGM 3693]|uniref:hypothetical protein n=1 Tax=Streptomyces sp. RGM 3693 TaxID=3413284 RepID=UPI003D2CF547
MGVGADPAVKAPAATTGLDVARRSLGRRRGIATGAVGLLIAVRVTAASAHDDAIDTALLGRNRPLHHGHS